MKCNPLLSGVRVLDLSRLLPGPFCTLYLAQMGAEVIKIEEPNGGDYARLSPELFNQINRAKKSVTLDLRKADDVHAFKQLVATADVVLESFRPGVMDKLGCGYEELRQINSRLVYAALTGYGQTGPYRDRPGHDINYRGYAGELDQTGLAGGTPAAGNFQVADLAGGALTCAVGILGALIGARASGVGSFVDVSMTDGTLALQVLALATTRSTGQALPRGSDMLSGALPNYGAYACADGKYLAVGALEPKFFSRMCQLLQRPDLLKKPQGFGAAGAELRQELAKLFKTRSRDEWEQLLAGEDSCVSAVLTPQEALQDEHFRARGMIVEEGGKPAFNLPIQFSNAFVRGGRSPGLGEHTAEVVGNAAKAVAETA